MAAFACAD